MSWTYQPDRLKKPRPNALDKQDRRVRRESEYKRNRQIALRRDQRRCRVCGKPAIETHHVVARSLGGSHEPSNLLSMCAADHKAIQTHVLKIEGATDANGLLRILKWSDAEKGYVLFREAA
jgi:5-methylcytosine-specific restriction endonuclease McrA